MFFFLPLLPHTTVRYNLTSTRYTLQKLPAFGACSLQIVKKKIFSKLLLTMDNDDRPQKARTTPTTSIAVIAIVTAPAVLGIVAITAVSIPIQQKAEAGGCPFRTPDYPYGSIPFNASQGRCLHP
jgi:hypothetical protein